MRTDKQKHLSAIITTIVRLRRVEVDSNAYHALMGIEPQQIYLEDLQTLVDVMKHQTVKQILTERPEWKGALLLCCVRRAIMRSSRPLINFVLGEMPVDEAMPVIVRAIDLEYQIIADWWNDITPDFQSYYIQKKKERLEKLFKGIQYTLARSGKEWRNRRKEILDQVDGKVIAELAAFELDLTQ